MPKIDMEDVDDINQVMSLGEFLNQLGIKSSDSLLEICDDALTAGSCDECGEHLNYECNCHNGGRYMREYDDGADYED